MIANTETKNGAAFWHAYNSPAHSYLVLEGGTSSSKTFSALFCFVLLASIKTFPTPVLISFIAESVPKLKVGMMRDFRVILGDSYEDKRWNATDRIYTFSTGNVCEFLNADAVEKVKGPRRDFCLIDEANHLQYDIARHVFIRTRSLKVITHNPSSEYWAHEELQPREDVSWVHSTFLDALHVVPEETVREILRNKDRDPNWWRVYGLGLIGNIEGIVHPSFRQIDEMPTGGVHVYGLDFGFTNDPTVLIESRIIGDNLYSDELIYERGLHNSQIVARMAQLGVRKNYDIIYADAANPKDISEIKMHGYNIKGCPKPANSILTGIQKVNQFNQHWTKRSVNSIKEQRNYRYLETSDGKITNKPIDDWNHAMDARRYSVFGQLGTNSVARGAKLYF